MICVSTSEASNAESSASMTSFSSSATWPSAQATATRDLRIAMFCSCMPPLSGVARPVVNLYGRSIASGSCSASDVAREEARVPHPHEDDRHDARDQEEREQGEGGARRARRAKLD